MSKSRASARLFLLLFTSAKCSERLQAVQSVVFGAILEPGFFCGNFCGWTPQFNEGIGLDELRRTMRNTYADRKEPQVALSRDLMRLFDLGAIHIEGSKRTTIKVNLDWPMQITESDFFELLEKLPKSKTHRFLASAE